ncbi:hypothetical protein [Mycolicibacterium brumae]|uniref:Uncharacterized protein n=2 Tax=Mycolicibacterium brumae TaxID=85968 RepID=A0A2G5P6Z9_9MYCO|nr:hypothetical protein [Mycolicibacterium brumae]PIB73793.1 hypothetical protein CQY22_015555 [Mycolicibacterium brumae]RWA19916.1 hypothetical protein MBRU_15985 [Mycolicibacterium brumae DSM 44177]UWW09675.1 hypothetical protein L2Z93_002786 [Mycolicibacterium brumae]
MAYDTSCYIDPDPRMPGFHDVGCRIRWIPRTDGRPELRVAEGDFLDGDSRDGAITLGCGIEEAAHQLGIDFLHEIDHLLDICELVDRQLAEHPWAMLKCPQGTAVIELLPRDNCE